MVEVKHTAGPWEARTFLVMGGKKLSDRICHVGVSTSLGPSRSNESVANARLIAAAPDLLDALVELMDVLRKEAPGTTLNNQRFDGLGVKAYAAISKATLSPPTREEGGRE